MAEDKNSLCLFGRWAVLPPCVAIIPVFHNVRASSSKSIVGILDLRRWSFLDPSVPLSADLPHCSSCLCSCPYTYAPYFNQVVEHKVSSQLSTGCDLVYCPAHSNRLVRIPCLNGFLLLLLTILPSSIQSCLPTCHNSIDLSLRYLVPRRMFCSGW